MFWNNSWFFPSHEFIFILIHEIFFDFFLAKNVKIRKIFTHGYSYNNQNILTWMNLLEWSSYMHISLCVVSVMAAAAADFPRLAKWLAAANLRQHTSAARCLPPSYPPSWLKTSRLWSLSVSHNIAAKQNGPKQAHNMSGVITSKLRITSRSSGKKRKESGAKGQVSINFWVNVARPSPAPARRVNRHLIIRLVW